MSATFLSTLTVAASDAVSRWTDPSCRPLFKGKLIDGDGCACAQGDVLLHNGYSPDELRSMTQRRADLESAKLLGISVAHAVLLRMVNDSANGCPQDVLTNPEKVLGDQASTVLSFWHHLDRMSAAQWAAAGAAAGAAARDAAWDAAWAAAWTAAWDVAGAAARDAAWDAARDAAGTAAGTAAGAWDEAEARAAARAAARASNEIQGAHVLRAQGKPFYFLPLFGFADPEAIPPLASFVTAKEA